MSDPMSDPSSASPSRRTLLSAAAVLGLGSAVAGSLTGAGPATALEVTMRPGPLTKGSESRYEDTLYRAFPNYPHGTGETAGIYSGYHYADEGVSVVAIDPATGAIYAGSAGTGEWDAGVSAAPPYEPNQSLDNVRHSPNTVPLGQVIALAPSTTGKMFIGDATGQLFAHTTTSGVTEAGSYRLLGKSGKIEHLAASTTHVAYTLPSETQDRLGAVNLTTGALITVPYSTTRKVTGLAVAGGTAFLTVQDRHAFSVTGQAVVVAIRLSDGAKLWEWKDGSYFAGSPVALGTSVYVLVQRSTGTQGYVHQLSQANGAKSRSYELPLNTYDPVFASLILLPGTTRLAVRCGSDIVLISTIRQMMNTLGTWGDWHGQLHADKNGYIYSSQSRDTVVGVRPVTADNYGYTYHGPYDSPFADLIRSQLFFKEMCWLAETGVSTGWVVGGKNYYRALNPINRDAMAAFLYRLAGKPAFTAPAVSPFTDIKPGQLFYKEMCWLAAKGISAGWDVAGGKQYRPLSSVNRDAMAAFLYRMAGSPEFTAPVVSPFADVAPGQQHYKAMAWLFDHGISTGTTIGAQVFYEPLAPVKRDAMAAFLYRLNAWAL